MELVSVIVPVHNVEKKKRVFMKMVQSVLKQTYTNFELILIDDGSSDKTYSLLTKLQNKDSRIFVHHKLNEGVEKTRRLGLALARGGVHRTY